MKLKHFLWTLPFICFIGSYFVAHWALVTEQLIAPCLIGKQLPEVMSILTSVNLNARILTQKEDNDLPTGTILSQIPLSGHTIRPHQSVFLVTSKQSPLKIALNFLKKNKKELEFLCSKEGISLKTHYVPSKYPEGTCIGQIPGPNQPLPDNKVTVYLSNSNNKLVIVPSFKKHFTQEVVSFLDDNALKYKLIHSKPIEQNHVCRNCIISDQRPMAGTLIDLKKEQIIQLYAT